MPIVKITRAIALAATVTCAVAIGGAASAAPVLAPVAQSVAPRSTAMQVYWVYRHHHRYWVPDRRRGYRGDYRR